MKRGLATLGFFLALSLGWGFGVSEGRSQTAAPPGPAKPEQPEIIVDQAAAKMTNQLQRDLEEKLRPRGQGRGGVATVVSATSLSAFLQPEEVSQITVDLYDPRATAWVASEPWNPESIKKEIQFVLTVRTENGAITSGIGWSEGNSWSVAATVLFKSGKQGKLYLDGLHVCYEAPEGHHWYFRALGPRPG